MKKKKKFDCVQMKWDIQKKLYDEFKDLTLEEQRQRSIEIILSNPITAKIWRNAKRTGVPDKFAEVED